MRTVIPQSVRIIEIPFPNEQWYHFHGAAARMTWPVKDTCSGCGHCRAPGRAASRQRGPDSGHRAAAPLLSPWMTMGTTSLSPQRPGDHRPSPVGSQA
jgi:hypothetical protein